MFWGKAFMPPPWSNAFDTLGQYPPGSRNPKEERERERKKAPKEAVKPCVAIGCVCTCTHATMSVPVVCSKSPTCYDYILCDACACVYVCVFRALRSEW